MCSCIKEENIKFGFFDYCTSVKSYHSKQDRLIVHIEFNRIRERHGDWKDRTFISNNRMNHLDK